MAYIENQKSYMFCIQIHFGTLFLCQSICVWKIHVENLVFVTNLH